MLLPHANSSVGRSLGLSVCLSLTHSLPPDYKPIICSTNPLLHSHLVPFRNLTELNSGGLSVHRLLFLSSFFVFSFSGHLWWAMLAGMLSSRDQRGLVIVLVSVSCELVSRSLINHWLMLSKLFCQHAKMVTKYLCNITGFTTHSGILVTYLLNLLTGPDSTSGL